MEARLEAKSGAELVKREMDGIARHLRAIGSVDHAAIIDAVVAKLVIAGVTARPATMTDDDMAQLGQVYRHLKDLRHDMNAGRLLACVSAIIAIRNSTEISAQVLRELAHIV